MTCSAEYLFISHRHIDNQPLPPDTFKPSSGQNLWGLGLFGLPEAATKYASFLLASHCTSSMSYWPVIMTLACIRLPVFPTYSSWFQVL
jgi:hypothetical protein